jgi:hypothetical protein
MSLVFMNKVNQTGKRLDIFAVGDEELLVSLPLVHHLDSTACC